MSVVFVVLPIALVVVLIAVFAYSWAVRRGQFDDLTTPAIRMLHDDAEGAGFVPEEQPAPEKRPGDVSDH